MSSHTALQTRARRLIVHRWTDPRSVLLTAALLVLAACGERAEVAGPSGVVGPLPERQFEVIVQSVTDLGSFGGDLNLGRDVNDVGQIAGFSAVSFDNARAFRWENGALVNLGTLGGAFSFANGINDLGQIVGQSMTSAMEEHAFLWEDGVLSDLGTLGGDTRSVAGDINNLGQIVGLSQPSFVGADFRAVLWPADGGMLDLGTLGGVFSVAIAINDLEQIVGMAATGAGDSHAFLWQDGVMQDLGTLGGTSSTAAGINELGQVVGWSTTGAGDEHAFLWQDGVMHDLGTLGGSISLAFGINNLGQIVGESTTGSGDRHAFLWQDGIMHDLGTLGGADSRADAINHHGDVAGSAETATTTTAAVRWIVPILASVEVEPGRGKNPGGTVKLGGSDNLTVVVHGNPWFNAVNVDPATLTLGDDDGNDTFVSRKKGVPQASLKDVDGDGDTDLVLAFSEDALVQNGDLSAATTELTLLGDRMDGRRIRGLAEVAVEP